MAEADTKPEDGADLPERQTVPLPPEELPAPPTQALDCLEVTLWPTQRRAAFRGQELQLTPTEFLLLETLLRHPGRAFSRRQLMHSAIGGGAIVLERTIDVHIKSLRRKLGDADLIETVRRVGYRFREKPAT